jgi:hypothetical protein
MVVRGNGEMLRLPSRPEEKGPVVSALLDRAQLDDLLRAVAALPDRPDAGPFVLTASLRSGVVRRSASAADAATSLSAGGRNLRTAARPDRVLLRTIASTRPPEGAPPWPLRRPPGSYFEATALDADPDRWTSLLEQLRPGAAFSFEGAAFEVADVDLLPP